MTESIDQEKPQSSICDFSIKSGMSGSTNDNNTTGTTGGGVGGPTVPQTNTTGVTSSIQANAIPKAIIKNVDMSDEMQQIAVDIACEAMLKFSVEKDIAAHVKKTMDTRFGPTWHTVVGKNYGSYVTHETKHFIYFYLGQIAFLLWRA